MIDQENVEYTPEVIPEKYTFKILGMGDHYQDLANDMIVNRPFLQFGERKKFGNEYLLFPSTFGYDLMNRSFIGKFTIQTTAKQHPLKCLHLIHEIKHPTELPNYYVIAYVHTGQKVDKNMDIIPTDKQSKSQIFSSAYHEIEPTIFEHQTIAIVQHGDELIIDGRFFKFNGKTGLIEPIC